MRCVRAKPACGGGADLVAGVFSRVPSSFDMRMRRFFARTWMDIIPLSCAWRLCVPGAEAPCLSVFYPPCEDLQLLTSIAAMGAALSFAGLTFTAAELVVERGIAAALSTWHADLAATSCGSGKDRPDNPATPIIPDSVLEVWKQAAARAKAVVKGYLARAVAVPLITTTLRVSWSDGREWNMPLVSATEPLSAVEAAAIAKFHLARQHFPRKYGVYKRLGEVPASVRLQVRRQSMACASRAVACAPPEGSMNCA